MDFTLNFQPRQIVCLEHRGTYLYAEVIQVVVSRQCAGASLVMGPFQMAFNRTIRCLYDLRAVADLSGL